MCGALASTCLQQILDVHNLWPRYFHSQWTSVELLYSKFNKHAHCRHRCAIEPEDECMYMGYGQLCVGKIVHDEWDYKPCRVDIIDCNCMVLSY